MGDGVLGGDDQSIAVGDGVLGWVMIRVLGWVMIRVLEWVMTIVLR